MKDKYLTTEPPLDEPEEVNYTYLRMIRDSKQESLQETFYQHQQSQDDNNDHWDTVVYVYNTSILWNTSFNQIEVT